MCDACNRRLLQKIDEEILLIGPLRFLGAQFGLAPRGKDIAQGISYDHGKNEFSVDTTKLRNNNAAEFDPVRGEITMQVSGPSAQARGEYLTRGLHRIAYNVLAHHHGGEYVRRRYRFLRDLELVKSRRLPCDNLDWQPGGHKLALWFRRLEPRASADLEWDIDERTLRVQLYEVGGERDQAVMFEPTLDGIEAAVALITRTFK